MNVFARALRTVAAAGLAATVAAPPAGADGVTYTDIGTGAGAGIDYRRVESPRDAIFDELKQMPVYTLEDIAITPIKSHGSPGVAVFDHDGDGDLDIYVTNGPGAANSLYSSQLLDSGQLSFVDVASAVGVEATDQDSNGTCYGDIDNDGDPDLLVLGAGDPSRLFENAGGGTFIDITAASGVGGGNHYSTTCAFGDVNGDGLLDLAIGNTYQNWDHQLAIFVEPYIFNEHNQLFLNLGGNTFTDASATSGIEDTRGMKPPADGEAGISWSIAVVDVDLDGDTDILYHGGLDFGPVVDASNAGAMLENLDCSAIFDYDLAATSATDHQRRNVQGVAIGDLNDDGLVDVVSVSNLDSLSPIPVVPYGFAFGSPFDFAAFVPTFTPIGPGEWIWNGIELPEGSLSVEIASGATGNGWAKVTTVGTVGLTSGGGVNRDGIGAVVSFTPAGGPTSMVPVADGGSYGSSSARELVFGLGASGAGTIDILWPGGVRNRLYDVEPGERIVFPEIPCSYDGEWKSKGKFTSCVAKALGDIAQAGLLSPNQKSRFLKSQKRALDEQ
jgi:hypothetical protein